MTEKQSEVLDKFVDGLLDTWISIKVGTDGEMVISRKIDGGGRSYIGIDYDGDIFITRLSEKEDYFEFYSNQELEGLYDKVIEKFKI